MDEITIIYHVKRFEDLTLVTSSVTIKSKSSIRLLHIFLCEGEASPNRHLRPDNTVPTKEGWGENVHRTTFTARHPPLTAEQFSNDTLDCPTAHHGEGVATIGGDDAVILSDTMLETNRHCFLFTRGIFSDIARIRSDTLVTYLADSQMAETADEFCFVEGISGHLHTTHGLHLLVHPHQQVLRHLHIETWQFAVVSAERVFMEFYGKGF